MTPMGWTLAEKIVSSHAGGIPVAPGDAVFVHPDLVSLDERQAERLLDLLEESGETWPRGGELLRVIPGHFAATSDPGRASVYRRLRQFFEQQEWTGLSPLGRGGSLAVGTIDGGYAIPGHLVLGSDGHLSDAGAVGCLGLPVSEGRLIRALAGQPIELKVPASIRVRLAGTPGRWCTGLDVMLRLLNELGKDRLLDRVVELHGPALDHMDMIDRLAMTSVGFEAGLRSVLLGTDETTLAWLRARTEKALAHLLPDGDAAYEERLELNLDGWEPMVALAPSPYGARPVSELPEIPVDQVVIGHRAGGRVEDLRLVARLLNEHPVHGNLRLLIVPGSQKIFQHCAEEGLVATLVRVGALVATPMMDLWESDQGGTLGEGEVCLTTTTENRTGWQGPASAKIHFSSPAVAAATAAMGRIAHPDEVLRSRRESA
ncbi:MAG: aconitase family protein [Planctomycetota bacterium]